MFEPLRAALAGVAEHERYRLLATLFNGLAEHNGGEASKTIGSDQLQVLNRKIQDMAKEKAGVEDMLRTKAADLAAQEKRLKAEQARADELQAVINDQSARLKKAEEDLRIVEAEVVARNNELHQAESKVEELQVKAQRAELALSDHSRIDQLETSKRELVEQSSTIAGQLEQLRADKDAEIERLKSELSKSNSVSSESADKLMAEMWRLLAVAKPPLSEGHIPPTTQAAARLVEGFIELARFVDDFDKSLRVFLGRYTKHHPSVKVPWDAYAKGADLLEFVRKTVAPRGGRPVGPLKMRLRLLYQWTQSGMVGADAAVESIGTELQDHLLGSVGAGADPNRKIRDYIRDDGHLLFAQHIKELRSLKLAETFGRG